MTRDQVEQEPTEGGGGTGLEGAGESVPTSAPRRCVFPLQGIKNRHLIFQINKTTGPLVNTADVCWVFIKAPRAETLLYVWLELSRFSVGQ